MNLNEFVVLPNSKAKSVKLNVRNPQKVQMETVTMAQENKEMEVKLLQLKDSMSREKEERVLSGGVRWNSGKAGPIKTNCGNSAKKNENLLQKLSEGKLKIRVLKYEQQTAPAVSHQMTRQNRLRGTHCGQCKVKAAGLTCAECTEDYCIGCFAKFHHKGALKLHRMIPIQTHLQTRVKQKNPGSSPSTVTNLNHSPKSKPSPNHLESNEINIREVEGLQNGRETVANPVQLHPDLSQQVLQEEKRKETIEEEPNRLTEKAFPNSLLRGEYSEEESERCFQEALRQWRGEKAGGGAMWTPVQPVSVSAATIQADLSPDRGTEGPGKGKGKERVPVRVEFTEHSLTYMDRLLLKMHRRTPIKMYHPSPDFLTDLDPLPKINPEEETTSSIIAQAEDFHRYCVSLFAIPVSQGGAEPQITTPESFLTIEVLDENISDTDGDFVAEQRTDDNTKSGMFSADQRGTLVPRTDLSSDGSTGVSCSSPSTTQASRHSGTPTPPKSAQNLSKPKNIQAEHSKTSSSSKIKLPACPTSESLRASKTSIRRPPSTSQAPTCTPRVQKSKLDSESRRLLSFSSLPHSQARILKPHTPVSLPPDVSPLPSSRPPIPEDHLSTSPLLLEQPQFSQLLPETVLSLELSQSLSSNLESLGKSQQSLSEPESLLLVNKPKPPGSLASSSQNLSSKSLESSRVVKTLSSSSLVNESPSDAYYRHWSAPTNEDDPSLLLNVIQNPVTVKMEEEEKLLTGSEPSSGLSTSTEEDLVFRMMMDNHKRPPGSHVHSTTTTSRGEISANELGSHLAHPRPGSALGPALRALSQAAQEIVEICRVDQAGCEDPDLDTDTMTTTLHELQQELRLMTEETGNQASVFGSPSSESQGQHGSHHFIRDGTSEEREEAEMVAERDRQSVLLLP